ncbi:MAG: type II secretion system F family protein [Verrucomicrobiota bacterium]
MIAVLAICVLVTFTLIVLAFQQLLKPQQVSLASRLKAVESALTPTGGVRDEEKMRKSLLERAILPLATRWSKRTSKFMPSGMVTSCQKSITQAGLSDKVTGVQLTTISWMLMIGLTILVFILFMPSVAQHKIKMWHLISACTISAILGFRLPIGIVASRAKKRKHEIQKALPFTFDLISISVEAGMAFDGAMSVVAQRTVGPLSDELKRALHEINLGISRYDALNNLGERSGVEDLQSFITAVNYISKLGGSLVEVIKIQTEAMRVKRRQRAETLAAQAPVKIMIPLVLFILPCIFIVVLAPPMMQAFKQLAGRVL